MVKALERPIRFGPFTLDPAAHLLRRDGEPVALKPKVFDLLLLLAGNPGRLLSKQELMVGLWGGRFVEDSNLTQSVYELRRALGGRRDGVRYLETVPRCGYRFVAPVREETAAPGASPVAAAPRSVAVLPFTPLGVPGPAAGDAPLELGLAETLIAALSPLPGLTVRQPGSIRGYGGSRDSLAAGRDLEVEAVLDGAVQRAGERLRVTVRLLRVTDGAVLWAQRFDTTFADIFAVQDTICEQVVAALRLRLPAAARARLRYRHTEDPEVHALFLECRDQWHRWTPEGWWRSIDRGRRALARDPAHAPSHAWMAASWCALGIAGAAPPREAFRQAAELVEVAVRLDADLSEAHEVRGAIELFHRWRWGRAERALHRALDLNPSNAGARDLLALLRIVEGRPEEAIREVRRALAADPLSRLVNTDVGNVLYYARRFEDAVARLRHTLELDPGFAHARFGLGYAWLQSGRPAAAVAAMRDAVEASGRDPETSPDLGYALAASGDRRGAERVAARLAERAAERFVDPFHLALVHLGLGDLDATFEWLDRALGARSRELIYLGADPVFDPLRSDPRFTALTARVGL